jgi:hypothetical protein
MPTKKILESHPVSVLKKEISKTNIKGYSKMKKSEIIDLMMKPEHKDRFHHIEMAKPKLSKKEKAKKQKEGDDFVAAGAEDVSMDTIIITPKKRKRKAKAKAKVSADVPKSPAVLTVTKADGSVKELKMKKKREYRRTVGKKST